MSRLHDALRRGRAGGATPAPPRSAQTDAVLAALGYQSGKRSTSTRLLVIVAAIAIGIAVGWTWWPVSPHPASAPAAVVQRLPPRPVPPSATPPAAASAPRTLPAVSVRSTPEAPPLNNPAKRPDGGGISAARVPPGTPPAGQVKGPLAIAPRSAAPATPRASAASSAVPQSADEFRMALYHQRAGDFEQAVLHYRAALQKDEMNVEAHNNLGSLYLSRNLLEEATREFQRVLAIEPGYAPAHINLSAAFYKLGRFDAAAAQAREALRVDPKSGDGFVNLALAQKAAGQPGEAEGSLRRALELDARHAIAHYNLARQYDEAGETVRALEHYRQFLQYAGPEQEPYAEDVRSRLKALSKAMK